ncbi:MAG: MoaD/ThiS family protein [Chloroflexi bacterium]|nr:MoaD/ThiS family protein [Chloroflexota bacterium]
MKLYLGGHLDWYAPDQRARHEFSLTAPTALLALVQTLGIPPAEIVTTAVNGTLVDLEAIHVSDEDVVELFSAIGGG